MLRLFHSDWSFLQTLYMNILKQGQMPDHIGIIMDGNRTYARNMKLASVTEGHRLGLYKLAEAMKMCMDLGVGELTMFAFSIENFKRSREEVEGLLGELLLELMIKFIEEIDSVNERGVCVEVIGKWSLIPDPLRSAAERVMLLTRNNKKFKLNVAIAYTARCEIAAGASDIINGISSGEIQLNDICEGTLDQVFWRHSTKPVDMLIRTAGECRFSDFLLWQASDAFLHFIDIYWPAFGNWDMMRAIFHFQARHL